MRDFATQYEKTLMRGTLTVDNIQREQLCALRTPTVRVDDPAVLVGYNNPQNYTHWIFATLPRLWYRKEFPELADLPIVIPPLTTRFRAEENTSELQSLMRHSYAVLCLKKKKHILRTTN